MPALFDPITLGAVELPTRIVMAPLTRLRSAPDGTPSQLNVEHYAQRASVGLIITEGTYPSAVGRSYPGQPGIVTDAHQQAWAEVIGAVHDRGGRVAMQIMHGGRVSHPEILGGAQPVAPSAVAPGAEIHLTDGRKAEIPAPRALSTEEVDEVREEFVAAARRAVDAGADLVELHGANGYLLHQFLAPAANRREDAWGGSPQARAAFPLAVARSVAAEIGADRTAIRLSPGNRAQGTAEDDAADLRATYGEVLRGLDELGVAYVSLISDGVADPLVPMVRELFGGPLLLNTGWSEVTDHQEAREIVESGAGDAAVVGRSLIANPDLVRRWREDLPLNAPDPGTFYGGGAAGYTDYPFADATR